MQPAPTPDQVATLLALADYVESDDSDFGGEPVTIVKRLEPDVDIWWVYCRCWKVHGRNLSLDANGWTVFGKGDAGWNCPFAFANERSIYYSPIGAAEAFSRHLRARPCLEGGVVSDGHAGHVDE